MSAKGWRRVVIWASRGVLVAWGAFWTWFSLAGALEVEHWWKTWVVALPAVGLVAAAWRWPVVGGCVVIGAGLVTAYVFAHPAAQVLMTLPMVVGGLGCAVAGWNLRLNSEVVSCPNRLATDAPPSDLPL